MAPAIDSYMAYGVNSGVTRLVSTFVAWPGVAIHKCSSGQADANGNFGATTVANQQTAFNIPIYGINNEGHGTNGVLKDRLIAHGFAPSDVIKIEGSAHAGKLAGEFAGAQPPGAPAHYLWSGVETALVGAPPGTRVVIPLTQGGNDLIAQFGQYLVDTPNQPAIDAFWTSAANTAAAACESNVDYMISKKPPGVLLEIVWPSYPNLMVEDGIPIGYPPNGNPAPGAGPLTEGESPNRSVWLTQGFGFYNQAINDMRIEAQRYGVEQAALGNPFAVWYYDIFGQLTFNGDAYAANISYWNARISPDCNILNPFVPCEFALDVLSRIGGGGRSGQRGADPLIWINAVKNISQVTVNGIFHKLHNACATVAAKYQPGGPKHNPEVNVVHVDMRTAMDPDPAQISAGIPAAYVSAPKEMFVEGVHLNYDGWVQYFDRLIAQWFPRSMFADISCAPTAVPDFINTQLNTVGAVNVLLNDLEGDTTILPGSVQVLNPLNSQWGANTTTAFEGTWVVTSPTVSFIPYTDFFGNSQVTYRFRTADGRYASSTITATVAQPPPRCPPQVADLYMA